MSITERLRQERVQAAWLAHRGSAQSAAYGFRSVNTKHRRHCFAAGYQAAQAHIDALEQELERVIEMLWKLNQAARQILGCVVPGNPPEWLKFGTTIADADGVLAKLTEER